MWFRTKNHPTPSGTTKITCRSIPRVDNRQFPKEKIIRVFRPDRPTSYNHVLGSTTLPREPQGLVNFELLLNWNSTFNKDKQVNKQKLPERHVLFFYIYY